MEQVEQFILESGSVPEQVTIVLYYYLCILPYTGASILYPGLSTFSYHFTNTMVDISYYRFWILIVDPYVDEPYIC